MREARQIKKYLFFFSFTSANKLEVEKISQVYNYMKGMGIGRKYGHRQCPDLTGDWSLDDSLGDGGHSVPLLEALTYTRCGELLQLGCE